MTGCTANAAQSLSSYLVAVINSIKGSSSSHVFKREKRKAVEYSIRCLIFARSCCPARVSLPHKDHNEGNSCTNYPLNNIPVLATLLLYAVLSRCSNSRDSAAFCFVARKAARPSGLVVLGHGERSVEGI